MAFKMRSGNKVSFKNMGSSPAKQGYTPHKPLTHEERQEAEQKEEMENKKGTGYTPHKEETHEEKLERVRKEEEESRPGPGVDTTPADKTYFFKKLAKKATKTIYDPKK